MSTLTGGPLVGNAVPIPTKKQPIRPQPRRETSPFVKIIDGQRVIDDSPAPPDPDAIARLMRLGLLREAQEVVVDDEGYEEEITVLKKRKPAGKKRQAPTRPVFGRMQPTYDIAECIELAKTGKWTSNELAERYGVKPSTIRARLRGVVSMASTKTQTEKIIDLYVNQQMTVGEIHQETGHAHATIYRVINNTPGVERRDDRFKCGGSVSPENRAATLERRGRMSTRQAAREVGISPTSVRRIWAEAENGEL